MFDHPLVVQIEGMQGNRILAGMWGHFYNELENALNSGELSSDAFNYANRLLLKLF